MCTTQRAENIHYVHLNLLRSSGTAVVCENTNNPTITSCPKTEPSLIAEYFSDMYVMDDELCDIWLKHDKNERCYVRWL